MVAQHNPAELPVPYTSAQVQPYHRAVAAMNSCFVLVRTHQHGMASLKCLTTDCPPRRLLLRQAQKHSFKHQLHTVNAMLMSPNKDANHGCHFPGDMAVRMREVLVIRRSFVV